MDDGINAVVLMDYVEFQIFPSHNRSHVCYGNKIETAASGLLEQLIIHSPKIISLHSKGSDVDFRFRPVRNLSDAKWFTKSTLIRIIDLIGFIWSRGCGKSMTFLASNSSRAAEM
ncbi:hypothetical protein CQW23_17121 [Capsicum baccatum]|uniref:Uncharacterized protein n=1 Tax=Capsicum baccatum TaxID=33114 RepID=A0A2G2WCV7_CAPBA|nr:hypothetical protein CQW23_17121 [Capsicum baccatum]